MEHHDVAAGQELGSSLTRKLPSGTSAPLLPPIPFPPSGGAWKDSEPRGWRKFFAVAGIVFGFFPVGVGLVAVHNGGDNRGAMPAAPGPTRRAGRSRHLAFRAPRGNAFAPPLPLARQCRRRSLGTGTRNVGCCAHAASGPTAAPPSSVMNSRRFIRSPRRRQRAACPAR